MVMVTAADDDGEESKLEANLLDGFLMYHDDQLVVLLQQLHVRSQPSIFLARSQCPLFTHLRLHTSIMSSTTNNSMSC